MRFAFQMAWRDSRASRRRLLLLSISVVLGIAALVAIGSLGANLKRAIDEQASGLLGADLVISGTIPTTPEWQKALADLHGDVARERFYSAPAVIGNGGRRVQVRAIEGNFPFYGEFITDPADGPERLKKGGKVAILDSTLMEHFQVKVGDSVKIGQVDYTIIATLKAFPGETPAFASLLARAFIPFDAAPEKAGGAQTNRIDIKLPSNSDSSAIVASLKKTFSEGLVFATTEDRKHVLDEALTQFEAFFFLVGFAGLFLGAIGVASVVHVYIRQKIATVAILRCLGASARQSFTVYLLQGIALGLFGAVLGAAIGLAAQWILPVLLKDLIPFKISFFISWPSIVSGMASGLAICLLFTLLPLLAIRRVSPLATLRSTLIEETGIGFDPWRVLIGVLIPVAVAVFATWQTHKVNVGVGYAVFLALSFGGLAATAMAVSWAARRWFPKNLPYVVRQGIANLYRPQNRTVLLLLSLGLGTILMISIFLVRSEMMAQFQGPEGGGRPNLIFTGVDESKMEALAKLTQDLGAPMVVRTPYVRIKMVSINAHPPARLWTDMYGKNLGLTASYRDHLLQNEILTQGKFMPRAKAGDPVIPIAIPGRLNDWGRRLKPGDEVDWDVQGVPLRTRVSAVYSARGPSFSPRFDILFPAGVLEGAPKYFDTGARAATPDIGIKVQRAVFAAYPEINVIDVRYIMEAVDRIFTKIIFVVEFMSSFIIGTGVLMLASAILTGRFQRIRETVLLRTLGATHRQLVQIQLSEYAILGILAALIGCGISVGGNYLIVHFVLKIPPSAPPLVLICGVGAVTGITLLTGWLANRGVTDHPPLVVLRQET